MDPLFIDVTADGIFATHPERAELRSAPVEVAGAGSPLGLLAREP